MKTFFVSIFAATALAISLTAAAADEPLPDYMKVRRLIETQAENPESKLNQQIQQLIELHQLPKETTLMLARVDFLQAGPKQELLECKPDCRFYERTFYRQISDIRWSSKDGTQMKAWAIGIYAHVFRVWSSDPQGSKLKLIGDETAIDTVTFL